MSRNHHEKWACLQIAYSIYFRIKESPKQKHDSHYFELLLQFPKLKENIPLISVQNKITWLNRLGTHPSQSLDIPNPGQHHFALYKTLKDHMKLSHNQNAPAKNLVAYTPPKLKPRTAVSRDTSVPRAVKSTVRWGQNRSEGDVGNVESKAGPRNEAWGPELSTSIFGLATSDGLPIAIREATMVHVYFIYFVMPSSLNETKLKRQVAIRKALDLTMGGQLLRHLCLERRLKSHWSKRSKRSKTSKI